MRQTNPRASADRIKGKSFVPAAQPDGAVPKELMPSVGKDLVAAAVEAGKVHEVRPAAGLPMALDGMKFSGPALTAKDTAALDFMFAISRERPDQQEHRLPFNRLADALKLSRRSDVQSIVDRLSAAHVSYNIQQRTFHERATCMSLVNLSIIEENGARDVCFSFPTHITRLLTGGLHFARVELSAMASFRSKWSGRLYKLLLRGVWAADVSKAGGTATFDDTPRDLAEAMGWTTEPFVFRDFKKAALLPALEDMKHLARMRVEYEFHHGAGRGRPVERVEFTVHVHPAHRAAVKTPKIRDGWVEQLRSDGLRPDAPEYFVPMGIFLKSIVLVPDECWAKWMRSDSASVEMRSLRMSQAWDVALMRALDGDEERLEMISDIKQRGAEEAAWRFARSQGQGVDILAPICAGTEPEVEYGNKGRLFHEHLVARFAREKRHALARPGMVKELPPLPDPEEPAPYVAPASTITVVLAGGYGLDDLRDALRPFRAASDAEDGIDVQEAWVGADGTHSFHAHSHRMRAGCAGEIDGLECIADVLPFGESEARGVLAQRDAKVARPSTMDVCLVLDSHAAVGSVYPSVKKFIAPHGEYGLNICVAIPKGDGWEVFEPHFRGSGMRPGSEAALEAIPGVIEVIPYRAEAARVLLSTRPVPTPKPVVAPATAEEIAKSVEPEPEFMAPEHIVIALAREDQGLIAAVIEAAAAWQADDGECGTQVHIALPPMDRGRIDTRPHLWWGIRSDGCPAVVLRSDDALAAITAALKEIDGVFGVVERAPENAQGMLGRLINPLGGGRRTRDAA